MFREKTIGAKPFKTLSTGKELVNLGGLTKLSKTHLTVVSHTTMAHVESFTRLNLNNSVATEPFKPGLVVASRRSLGGPRLVLTLSTQSKQLAESVAMTSGMFPLSTFHRLRGKGGQTSITDLHRTSPLPIPNRDLLTSANLQGLLSLNHSKGPVRMPGLPMMFLRSRKRSSQNTDLSLTDWIHPRLLHQAVSILFFVNVICR